METERRRIRREKENGLSVSVTDVSVCVCCSLLGNSILCLLPPYFLHLQNVSACQTRLPRLFVAFIAQAVLSNQVSRESQRERKRRREAADYREHVKEVQELRVTSTRNRSARQKKKPKTSVLMSHIFNLFVEKQS